MLIVAATTGSEVRARWFHSHWRSFQQPLVQALLVQLIDLGGIQLAAISPDLAVSVSADREQVVLRSQREERGLESLLEHRQAPLNVFQLHALGALAL